MSSDDLDIIKQEDFQRRTLQMTHSGDFRDLAWAQHQVGENRGFHPRAVAPQLDDARWHVWRQRQLLHLCIEVGELADQFRKTSRIDLEEAADVFIVLADLVCTDIDKAQLFYDTIGNKTLRNLRRPGSYGLTEE